MSAVRRRPRPDGHTRLPCSSGYRHAVIGGCTSVSAVVRSAPFAPSGSTTTTATTATAPAATAAAATTSPSGLALRAAQEATPRRHAERRQAGRQRERRAPGRPRDRRKARHRGQPVAARNGARLNGGSRPGRGACPVSRPEPDSGAADRGDASRDRSLLPTDGDHRCDACPAAGRRPFANRSAIAVAVSMTTAGD